MRGARQRRRVERPLEARVADVDGEKAHRAARCALRSSCRSPAARRSRRCASCRRAGARAGRWRARARRRASVRWTPWTSSAVDAQRHQEGHAGGAIDDRIAGPHHREEALGRAEHRADRRRRIREGALGVVARERLELGADDGARGARVGGGDRLRPRAGARRAEGERRASGRRQRAKRAMVFSCAGAGRHHAAFGESRVRGAKRTVKRGRRRSSAHAGLPVEGRWRPAAPATSRRSAMSYRTLALAAACSAALSRLRRRPGRRPTGYGPAYAPAGDVIVADVAPPAPYYEPCRRRRSSAPSGSAATGAGAAAATSGSAAATSSRGRATPGSRIAGSSARAAGISRKATGRAADRRPAGRQRPRAPPDPRRPALHCD